MRRKAVVYTGSGDPHPRIASQHIFVPYLLLPELTAGAFFSAGSLLILGACFSILTLSRSREKFGKAFAVGWSSSLPQPATTAVHGGPGPRELSIGVRSTHGSQAQGRHHRTGVSTLADILRADIVISMWPRVHKRYHLEMLYHYYCLLSRLFISWQSRPHTALWSRAAMGAKRLVMLA